MATTVTYRKFGPGAFLLLHAALTSRFVVRNGFHVWMRVLTLSNLMGPVSSSASSRLLKMITGFYRWIQITAGRLSVHPTVSAYGFYRVVRTLSMTYINWLLKPRRRGTPLIICLRPYTTSEDPSEQGYQNTVGASVTEDDEA